MLAQHPTSPTPVLCPSCRNKRVVWRHQALVGVFYCAGDSNNINMFRNIKVGVYYRSRVGFFTR